MVCRLRPVIEENDDAEQSNEQTEVSEATCDTTGENSNCVKIHSGREKALGRNKH